MDRKIRQIFFPERRYEKLRVGRSPGFPCAAPSRLKLIQDSGKGKTAIPTFVEKDYSCGNSFRFFLSISVITEFPFNSETNKLLKPTPLRLNYERIKSETTRKNR